MVQIEAGQEVERKAPLFCFIFLELHMAGNQLELWKYFVLLIPNPLLV